MAAVTRKKYEENFKLNDVIPPVGVSLPDTLPENAIIVQWYNFIDEENTYLWTVEYEIPVPDGIPIKKFLKSAFYCEKCKEWRSSGNTKHNLTRHFSVHGDSTPIERSRLQSQENTEGDEAHTANHAVIRDKAVASKISQLLIQFILLNCLPFRLIEDRFLNSICHTCSGEDISSYVSLISKLLKNSIKNTLSASDYISLAFDEWTDRTSRRYIGYTVHCMYKGRFMEIAIDHYPIRELHITGKYIAEITKEVLTNYSIEDRIQIACTDNGSNMISSFDTMNYQRIPCVCHCLNTFVCHFIDALRDTVFAPIFNLQAKLSKSTIFKQFLVQNKEKLSSVASYTQTRWYSIYELLDHLKRLQPLIYKFYRLKRDQNGQLTEEYLSQEEWTPIKKDLNENVYIHVRNLYSFFRRVMFAYKTLESDKFGTISLILVQFPKVIFKLNQLQQAYVKGVDAFKAVYKSYWSDYFNNFRKELWMATRLNPYLKHEELLTPAEIQIADAEIIHLMDQIRPAPENNNPHPNQAHSQQHQQQPTHEQQIHSQPPPQRVQQARRVEAQGDAQSDFSPISSDDENTTTAAATREEISNLGAFNHYVSNRPFFKKDIDLLTLWKTNSDIEEYKVLSQVAMKILSIIITSASAERLFSISARNTSYLRMRLSSHHVRDLALIAGNKEFAQKEMEVNPRHE